MSLSTLRLIVVTLVIMLVTAPLASAEAKTAPPDIPTKVKALGIGHSAFVQLTDGRHGSETMAFIDVAKLQKSRLTTGDKASLAILGVMVGTAIFFGVALYRSGITGSNGL
jgi:hypothetical protein